jgi:hypothetical protein
MNNENRWECWKCGYFRQGDEDGFKLLGRGFVRCPRCGTEYYVPLGSSELVPLGGKEESHAGSHAQLQY